MKRRYVFPLLVAVAVGSAYITDTLPEIRERFQQYKERDLPKETRDAERDRRIFDRSYRNIADAINRLCGDLPEEMQNVFTDWTKQVQKEWIEERQRLGDNPKISRLGPRLVISTDVANVDFIDTGYLCFTNRPERFRYREKLKNSGFHVVTVIGWEWQDAQLVSPGTGKVVGTYEQIVESPTGKRIAAYRQLGMDKNGLQIFRNEGGHLVSEYHSDSDRSEGDMSLSKVDSVSWIDDETMLAMLVDRSRATLTFRNGKWELQPGEAK